MKRTHLSKLNSILSSNMLDAVNIEWEPSFNHTENNLRTMYTKTDIHLESKPEPIAERPKSTGISAYDQLCKILDESD